MELTVTDEEIAKRVQDGDAEAFGELIVRYEEKLRRYGRRFLSNPQDIEDLVQDVMIKTYTNIQSFNTDMRFSPWVYRIAHNTFVNALKKQSRFGYNIFDVDTLLPQLRAEETADSETLSHELSEEMEQYLSELDVKYREPLVLFFYEEMTYQEISDILRIPVTTVGVRINRAKEKLRKLYEAKGVVENN